LTVLWTDNLSLAKTNSRVFNFSIGCAVLDIAVPKASSSARHSISTLPPIIKNGIIVAVACSDYTIRVLSLPLEPPETPSQHSGHVLATISHRSVPTSVSLTWTLADRSDEYEDDETSVGHANERLSDLNTSRGIELLIASCSSQGYSKISVSKVILSDMKDSTTPVDSVVPFQQAVLPHSPLKISFNPATYPSKHHSAILIPCSDGYVYIYDPFAYAGPEKTQETRRVSGGWIASFSTRFTQSNTTQDGTDSMAQRKRILDAHWALNGQVIIALLSDGEWGIWDFVGSRNPSGRATPRSSFVLWGMIGSGIPSHISGNLGPKRSLESKSSLPAMTPNTRRFREESLFMGQSKSGASVSRGGISVNPVPLPSADNTEDSIALWYNDTICYIDSLQAYWSRAARRSADTKLQTTGGSLFGPGLTRIEGIDLHGQTIISISQLVVSADDGVSLPKAVLLLTEHQLITSKFGAEKTIGQAAASQFQPSRRSHRHNLSQSLLSKGELDIAGLDSVMDDMANRPSDSKMILEPDNEYMTGALALPRV
jgi:hypothetical protein